MGRKFCISHAIWVRAPRFYKLEVYGAEQDKDNFGGIFYGGDGRLLMMMMIIIIPETMFILVILL